MSYMPLGRVLRHRELSQSTARPAEPAVDFVPAGTLLSGREHQIAVLVTEGLSNKEIAITLHISPWTVSAHLRRVFAKLDISRRIELCALLRAK